MNLTGLDRLAAHLPELNSGAGRLKLFGLPLLLFAFVTAFFATEDRTWPVWLLDGEVVFATLGFALLYMFFRVREPYRAAFGELAYARAARRFVFPGLAIIFAVIARIAYIPGPPIPRFIWYPVLPALGWLLVAVGALLWLRAVLAFGIDNLTMLYVYLPQHGQFAQGGIYGILRHPVYAGAVRVALGLGFLNGTWYGPICALFFLLGMWGWLRLVEERELIARFGPAYGEYRRRVPAFWPRLADLGRFLRFVILGK
jgi:protein-S-isoprenylcysteine O-methyltransferase Ste14